MMRNRTPRSLLTRTYTLLITGAAGFIGSHFVKIARKNGYRVICLDNLCRSSPETLLGHPCVQIDLLDAGALDSLFQQHAIDAVVHFAGFIDVGESLIRPDLYYKNNFIATLHLLEVMRKHNVRKILFSSSAAIFGLPETPTLKEEHPRQPIHPYGRTKWMCEQLLQDYYRADQMSFCALRYFNAAGGDSAGQIPYRQRRPSNLIPLALLSLQQQRPFTIFGTDYPTKDGTCIRDYVHVEDLAQAHLLAIKKLLESEKGSWSYNLGNGAGYSVLEVLRTIEETLSKKLLLQKGARREGDPPQLVAEASLAERDLLWRPQYPHLEQMVLHAWQAIQSSL